VAPVAGESRRSGVVTKSNAIELMRSIGRSEPEDELSMVRFQVSVRGSAVAVRVAELDADQIQHAVSHAALGDHFLGELAHTLYRTLEHHGLDTLIMIQMCMHRGNRQVVMSVLNTGKSFGELTFVVIVNIGEIGDTRALRITLLHTLLQMGAQDVAYRLAPIGVTSFRDECIERLGEVFVE
jgi:hypothetical protein